MSAPAPEPRTLPERIDVIDCTLRDGEQAPGVWFSVAEKVALGCALDEAGVAVLDAGYPAASGSDAEAIQELRARGVHARLGATARPLARDVAAAAAARADEVFLFLPLSELRLRETLGISRGRARRLFREGAEQAAGLGLAVNAVFEDATRTDPRELVSVAAALHARVPLARLVLCDTVGCGHPASSEALFREVAAALGGEPMLCSHAHNDFGLAAANTLAAVRGGARAISCTVNGIGERAGNADLAECAAALTHLLGVAHGIDPLQLPALARRVERASGIHMSALKPVTGFNVYRHESGVHVDGMLKCPRSYEFLPAGWTGRRTEYALGKHSGTALIHQLLAEAGLACDERLELELLSVVKRAAEARGKAEHERAYGAHEARLRALLAGVDPALLLARARDARARRQPCAPGARSATT